MSRRYKSSNSKQPFNRYTYESLAKIEAESDETVNFYAVILDASFPYKTTDEKWVCHLKVVDQTLNVKPNQEDFAIVLMQARRFEDLPICQRVGDIIRCHRAEYTSKEGQVYFKLNMAFSSSWSLFSANKEVAPEVEDQSEDWTVTPYAFSSYSFTFENNDRKILEKIRPWNKNYFSNNEVIVDVMYTSLDDAADEDGDFNILGKITQVVHRDNWMSDIRVQDKSGETFFTTISRRKFPRATEGEIIKIRSAVIDKDSNRNKILKLYPHSNI